MSDHRRYVVGIASAARLEASGCQGLLGEVRERVLDAERDVTTVAGIVACVLAAIELGLNIYDRCRKEAKKPTNDSIAKATLEQLGQFEGVSGKQRVEVVHTVTEELFLYHAVEVTDDRPAV